MGFNLIIIVVEEGFEMKKWQLLKICENVNVKKLKYTSYSDLLSLTDNQIDLIIKNINRQTIPILIDYFSMLNKGEYDFTNFERLGITDINKNITVRILYAESVAEAVDVLCWFRYKIEKFKTKEEWYTFMNNLSSDISLSNLSYVIDFFEDSRVEVIEKVMKNSTKLRTIYLSDVNKKKRLNESNILDLLDLVIMGYNVKFSTKLVKQLVKTKQDIEVYNTILNYLKNPNLFHENLPKIFIDIDISKLTYIIDRLEKIYKYKLLDSYLSYDFKGDKLDLLNQYVDRIIEKDNTMLKQSMIILLENKNVISDLTNDNEKLDIVVEKLESIDKNDKKNIMLTKLLEVIPYDKWISISSDLETEKLEYIYQNNKIFLDIINILDIDFVIDRFIELSLINIRKIFSIFSLKTFKLDLKKNHNLDNLFDLFNERLIDIYYRKYLLEEEKNKLLVRSNTTRLDSSSELEVANLSNVLDKGYEIDLVLDNYQDEEELNAITLIKTM